MNCGSMDMLDQLGAVNQGTGVATHQPRFRAWPFQKQIPVASIASMASGMATWYAPAKRSSPTDWPWGLHMHIGSGVDYAHLQEVCGAMLKAGSR